MKLKFFLDEILQSVDKGTTRRFNCPSCGSTDNSLSVSNFEGVIKYNCFKAFCTLKGSRKSVDSLDALKTRLNRVCSSLKGWETPQHWIKGIASKKCLKILLTTNSMVPYSKGYFKVGYDPEEERFIYFIEEDHKIVGAVGRSLGHGVPKVKNYPNSKPVPFTAGVGKTLVLTEDCASACAISNIPEFTGMALLGTNLKEEYIPYIAKYDNVMVALDYDARKKSLAIKNSLEYYCKHVKVMIIHKDIKDMSNEELNNVV